MTYNTVREAAQKLGCNPETIRRWIRAGAPAVAFMGLYWVNVDDLMTWRIARGVERLRARRKGASR